MVLYVVFVYFFFHFVKRSLDTKSGKYVNEDRWRYKEMSYMLFFCISFRYDLWSELIFCTFRFFSFDFARISMFEHFRGDWAYAESNFDELSKKCFPKIFTLVLLDGFLDGFSKFRLFIVTIGILIWYFWVIFEKCSMRDRMLSIRGNDFIANWAYEETISSHNEHTRNEFQPWLSMRGNV